MTFGTKKVMKKPGLDPDPTDKKPPDPDPTLETRPDPTGFGSATLALCSLLFCIGFIKYLVALQIK